jgi:CspA family cold shock protein
MKRMQGQVDWFDEAKGFGFIKGDDGNDVFVHFSEVDRQGFKTLHQGERVEYETRKDDGGPKAVRVKLLNS